MTKGNTDRSSHKPSCSYSKWYDGSAEYQPNHPLSEVVRQIMADYCTCDEKKDKQK